MPEPKSPTNVGGSGAHAAADGRPEFLVTLGLIPPCTVEDVKQAYLVKVKTAHPDAGGNADDFRKLQEAYEKATEWAKFRASRIQWLATWVEKYVEQDGVVADCSGAGAKSKSRGSIGCAAALGKIFHTLPRKFTRLPGMAQPSTTRRSPG